MSAIAGKTSESLGDIASMLSTPTLVNTSSSIAVRNITPYRLQRNVAREVP